MMPSQQTIDTATKIYTDFINNCELYDLVEHRITLDDFLCNVDEDKWRRDYKFFSGVEKVVVDFEDDDWVMKFDYAYVGECKKEADLYAAMEKLSYRDYLARTYYFPCGDYGFTLQEKVSFDEEELMSSYAHTILSGASDEELENYVLDGCAAESFDCGDDYERLSALFDDEFATYMTMELNLNDFHSGNMGFSKNGYLKLTDFSGYMTNDSEESDSY